jgi:hypothetical protein
MFLTIFHSLVTAIDDKHGFSNKLGMDNNHKSKFKNNTFVVYNNEVELFRVFNNHNIIPIDDIRLKLMRYYPKFTFEIEQIDFSNYNLYIKKNNKRARDLLLIRKE